MTSNKPVSGGTRGRYRKTEWMTALTGQVRVVGPIDPEGGAELLSEDGDVMDYRTAYHLTPEAFWRDFEPVDETLSRKSLATVIKEARETYYEGTTNWGLPYDYFVADRVLDYLEENHQ